MGQLFSSKYKLMRIPSFRSLGLIIILIAISPVTLRAGTQYDLDGGGWTLQSSAKLGGSGGGDISKISYNPKGWYPITVPCTCIGGLVQNNVYPNPYFSKNVSNINGDDFGVSWWYRKTFTLPAAEGGHKIWLNFKGISYRANVWLNGSRIADETAIVGTFREYELDISSKVLYNGQTNVLAVEVLGPDYNDLRLYFDDWISMMEVPDRCMGIFNPVYLATSAPVSLRHPLVLTTLDLPALDAAHLTVVAELNNPTGNSVSGTLSGTITGPTGTITISQNVTVSANKTGQRISFSSGDFPQLNVAHPAVWWPWQMGAQNLYTLNLRFVTSSVESDNVSCRFGIRQVTSRLDSNGHRRFAINGKEMLVRGAAWAPDMFLKWDLPRQEAEMRYVRDLNMNVIRLEGKLMNDPFFDLCDQYGIMVMAGWMCDVGWETWDVWDDEETNTAYASLKSQIYRLRAHPSLLVWLNGSDEHPPDDKNGIEQQYLNIESDLQWPNPTLSHAADHADALTGPSGVKMKGPYNWEPPIYWVSSQAPGGASGFATEICPGGAIPPLESLKQMLPANHLWPIDSYWDYHACGNGYTTALFTEALNARYGTATGVEDYAKKAQLAGYESHRAMFEGYGRKKYTATGVIQWMLNNAWPSMMWHLYDYYLRPGGAYFGAKIACEPLHILYAYDNQYIYVVDSDYTDHNGMLATADVYNLDGTSKYHHSQNCDIGSDTSNKLFAVPAISGLNKTYFLRLTLSDAAGYPVSINSYWLSTVPDVLDFSHNTHATQCSSYADMTGLQNLPPVSLSYTDHYSSSGGAGV